MKEVRIMVVVDVVVRGCDEGNKGRGSFNSSNNKIISHKVIFLKRAWNSKQNERGRYDKL